MAVEKQLDKQYQFGGLDLLSDGLVRPVARALEAKNCERRPDGSYGQRRGYDAVNHEAGGLGLAVYSYVDENTEQQTELITVKSSPKRLVRTAAITAQYSGGPHSVFLRVMNEGETRKLKVLRFNLSSEVVDLSLTLGTIFDDSPAVDLDGVVTALQAVTFPGGGSITASVASGVDGSTFACVLESTVGDDVDISSAASLYYYQEQLINTPEVNDEIFANDFSRISETDFRTLVSVNLNNCLYMTAPRTRLMKYDGQTAYLAGMKLGGTVTTALGSAGSLTGDYIHRITYVQVDNHGNRIEGRIGGGSSTLTATSDKINVTVTNIQASSNEPYNLNAAIVNGSQNGVNTILVDSGHTLQVGDTAYFLDGVSGDYVEREVTAIDSTEITIAGDAVNVADNAVISNNLRIAIWRTANAGSAESVFLVAEIPNNPFAATQVYVDDTPDNQLGEQYIVPLELHRLANQQSGARPMTVFQGLLVMGGFSDDQNLVQFCARNALDAEPEYWPSENKFYIPTEKNDIVTALKGTPDFLLVFKNESTHLVTGNLSSGNIRTFHSDIIGCPAQNTVREIPGGRIIFCSKLGVIEFEGGRLTSELSAVLRPVFQIAPVLESQRLIFERAYALVDPIEQRYILSIPVEETSGSNRYPDEHSRVFVYEYATGEWYEWTMQPATVAMQREPMNFSGGAVFWNDSIFFVSRLFSNGSLRFVLFKRHAGFGTNAYADHAYPINFDWRSVWDHRGDPKVLKSMERLALYSLAPEADPDFSITVQTYKDWDPDTEHSEADVDIVGAPRHAIIELVKEKVFALQYRLTHATLYERVDLSGFEVEVTDSHRKGLSRS